MGIDLPAFEFLLRANKTCGDFGSTVVLGRQRLLARTEAERERFARVLETYRPDLKMADIQHDYVDALIEALGGSPYHVMDNSAYEGAQVIHDLNEPLPEDLRNRYDTVIDIGTLEHVFNIGTGMKSMAELVAPGGQFLCLNVANHHLGHGFWQFGPEVFFRTFCPAHGFEPVLADLHYQGQFHPLRDPEAAGRRLPIKTPGYTYVTFAARKQADMPVFENGWPVQADYVAAWTVFLAKTAEREGDPAEAERILREARKTAPGNPAYMMALAALLRRVKDENAESDALMKEARALAPDHPAFALPEPAEAETAPQVSASAPASPEPDPVERVDIASVSIALTDPRVPEKTQEALLRGRYEFKEREIARRLLSPGDRVIELGAGMGVVSLTMARLVGADAVRSFEANPIIIELARENAAANALDVDFRHAIASPRVDAETTPHIDFFVLNSFEASSTRQVNPNQQAVKVPTTPLEDQIARHRANTLVFDIEGFETEIIRKTDLSEIEKLMLEIHPKIIGLDTCCDLIETLEAQGLVLRADLAFGDVLAFERGTDPAAIGGAALFRALCEMEDAARAADWPTARKIGQSLGADVSENAYVEFRLWQIESAMGERGLARAERAAELGSEDFLLFEALARAYAAAGDGERAGAATRKLTELFPRSALLETSGQA